MRLTAQGFWKKIVKMDVNKEKWVNEIMSSLDDVRSAEANPFLYNRILGKIENKERGYAPVRLVWLAIASLVVLIALNIFVMRLSGSETSGAAGIEQMATAYQFTNNFSYN